MWSRCESERRRWCGDEGGERWRGDEGGVAEAPCSVLVDLRPQQPLSHCGIHGGGCSSQPCSTDQSVGSFWYLASSSFSAPMDRTGVSCTRTQS